MKNVNYLISRNIIEIMICIVVVFITLFCWQFFIPNDMFEIARLYDKTSLAYVQVNAYSDYKFYPMNDESSLKYLQPIVVTLCNETNIPSSYHLVFRVSKDSSLDIHYLRYSIDKQVFSLKDGYFKEDSLYRYYLIDEGSITAGYKNYTMRIWLDESTPSEELGNTFEYSLLNLDNIVSM